MTPYYQDDAVTIWHGDAREILPSLGEASVDFIFTDPPYGHNNNDGDLAHRREAALGILPPGAAAPEGRPIANDGPEANDLARWLIRCTRCGQPVEVVELPGPHIDAATFVGVCCLEKP